MSPSDASADPTRSTVWAQVADELSRQADLRRQTVAELLRVPVGSESRESDPLNAAVAVRAMRALAEEWVPSDELPRAPNLQSSLSALAEIGHLLADWRTKIRDVGNEEWQNIQDMCLEALRCLRHASIASHLQRVDKVVSDINRCMPTVETQSVGMWKQAYQHASAIGLCDDASAETRLLEQFLGKAIAVKAEAEGRGALLARCQEAPLTQLRFLCNVLTAGEDVVRALLGHAEAVVVGGDAEGTVVAKVSSLGLRLTKVAKGLPK